ncbi:hypothetical protein F4811DRAFT_125572 [Daldinia bambusicola]|nr:hypothetical protein F4811DRAFT_125572 [Daldinia bambusicola]
MTSETLSQSLRFLTDAAHLLVKTAPEASAYLMSQRNSLIFHNDLEQSDLQRQHVCGACGHIMIPGQGSELKIDSNMSLKRKRAKNRNKNKNSTSKAVTGKSIPTIQHRKRFTCGMCSRYTDVILPPAPPISRRRPLKSTKTLSLDASHRNAPTPPEPVKASANASSKKRAKSRKQGLQALLQQAQSSASKPQSGLGLSLSDFMSK